MERRDVTRLVIGKRANNAIVLLLACLLGAALVFGAPALLAQDQPNVPPALGGEPLGDAWPGEYIVGIDTSSGLVSAAQAQLALSGALVDQVTACGSSTILQVWRLYDSDTAPSLQALVGGPGIEFIEPNWIVRAAGIPAPPPAVPEQPYPFDDTFYASRQWPMQRSSFARAWQLVPDQGLTKQKVRVAVIDSGIDFNHPDLVGRLLPGVNYITPGAAPNDDFGHGTHVTGIIAAVANNGKGIVGGAPDVEIDTLKMLGSTGGGTITNLIRAICDAADRSANVINMSLEVPLTISFDLAQQMQVAVDYAYSKGSLLVAAAGNSNGGPVYYPGRLNHVVAVAALTPENLRAPYSAIGTQLDIAAGGGSFTTSVLSTWPSSVPGKCSGSGRVLLVEGGAYYCTEPGTSMSAPLVSAAGALLMSVRPNLTNDEVETILEETARDVGLPQIEAGAGLLDVEAAVRRILDGRAVITPASIGAMVLPGALSFTQTVIVDNSSLAPVDVAGAIPLANWYDVINVQGGGFVASLVHGEPLYLTIVMSPTNLITGVYTNEIVLDLTYADGKKGVTSLPLLLGVGELSTQTYLPLIANRSSQPLPPSPSPLPFAWETPVVTPTVLSIGSGGSVKVSLPFAFPLSGVDITSSESYTEMQVYEDGFLVFADSSFVPVPEPSQNQCLPVLDQPAQAIFGWWADLNASLAGGEIMTFQPAPDRFVIQYENIASAAGVTPSYTANFQIVLHANGNVGLNYLDVPDVIAQALDELPPEVTVGVQAKSGLFHNQVTCITLTDGYGRPPHSETSILIKREDVY